jgi:soluble lytic murein transglycosylase-like protein
MRLLLVGFGLCAAMPAHALELSADLNSFVHAELSSFAYTAVHSWPGRPSDSAIAAPSMEPRHEPGSQPMWAGPAAAVAGNPDTPQFSKTGLCSTAASAASENKLPVRFFANLIQQESGFKPHVVSPAGAQGIAQFMPAVAAEQGLHNPFDPVQALKASAKFVANLVERFGNLGLAAAAYNAGSKRVTDWLHGRGKLPVETRNYVRSITGRPAENWIRVAKKGDQVQLPPHAQCPGVQTASSAAPDNGKSARRQPRAHQQTRLALNAVSTPQTARVKRADSASSKRAVVPGRARVRLAALR